MTDTKLIETTGKLKKQGDEADPVPIMAFNVWNIPGELVQNSVDHNMVAIKELGHLNMNEHNKIRVSIRPNTSINEAVQILEYVTDLLKYHGTDWKGQVTDVWNDVGKGANLPAIRECTRCGYTWEPKRGVPPKVCPKCKSYKWNIPK